LLLYTNNIAVFSPELDMILGWIVRSLLPLADHLPFEGFGTLLEGGRRKHGGDNGSESSDNCREIGQGLQEFLHAVCSREVESTKTDQRGK
jgi:hypothetical protein